MTTSGEWVDPDDAPELSSEWFDKAAVKEAGTVVSEGEPVRKRAGRPPAGEAAKVQQSLRLSPDVIAGFKEQGPGWQARIDDVLRAALPTGAGARGGEAIEQLVKQSRAAQEAIAAAGGVSVLARAHAQLAAAYKAMRAARAGEAILGSSATDPAGEMRRAINAIEGAPVIALTAGSPGTLESLQTAGGLDAILAAADASSRLLAAFREPEATAHEHAE